ncbi:MAG: sulfotransferase family 2 domain-containing protein [Acidocella sp.]|nr:sulfotransferase family 2 domain-containing protein [Acidocella sp.]
MIVSHEKKFIFVHNPKCAGTAFRAVIEAHHDHARRFWGIEHEPYFQRDIDYAHLRLWELAALFPDLVALLESYNSVAFVRNPFQRLISAISEHFKQYRPDTKFFELSASSQLKIAETFVSNELTLPRIQADFRYVHFSPQSWFLALGSTRKVKHVLPILADGHFGREGLERLGLATMPLKPLNMMTASLAPLLNSNIIRNFTMDFYHEDFQILYADAALRPVILQSPVPLDMTRIFSIPGIPSTPLLSRPASKSNSLARGLAALKPRKLMRHSVMKLRRALGF